MLKAQIEIGKVYIAKVSGKLCRVRIDRERSFEVLGGHRTNHTWIATNLETGREIRIRSAAKLRREVV